MTDSYWNRNNNNNNNNIIIIVIMLCIEGVYDVQGMFSG